MRDDDLERLPEPEDLLGLLRYVLRYQRVPQAVLAADARDALEVVMVLRAQLDDAELALIRLNRRMGFSWAQIAASCGLYSRQAAQQRMVRLVAACSGRVRSERGERNHRETVRNAAAWLQASRRRVLDLAAEAASAAHSLEDAADLAEDLAEELTEADPSLRALMALLCQMRNAHRAEEACSCALARRLAPLADAWDDVQGPPDP